MHISARFFSTITLALSASILFACFDFSSLKEKEEPKTEENDETIYSIETVSSLPTKARYDALREGRVQDDIELLEAFMDSSVVWWDGTPSSWSHLTREGEEFLADNDRFLKGTSRLMKAEYEVGQYHVGLSSFQEELIETLRRSPYAPTAKKDPDLEQLMSFWFGVKLFEYPKEGDLFRKVNPKAIKHLKGIIPKATTPWQGVTYGQAYNSWFRHPARMMALSYTDLLSRGIEKETHAYIYMAKREQTEGDRNALDYLFGKYDEELKDEWTVYEEYDSLYRCCSFRPAHAFGFWLRRHSDGSDQALWSALLGILKEYDSDWVVDLQKKYPKVEGIWDNPQQIISEKTIFSPENRSYLKIENIGVFFETVVDGYKISGFADQLVLPLEKHQITILNCLEEEEKGFCDCQHFEPKLEAKKQTTIEYKHETVEKCSSDGKPLKN